MKKSFLFLILVLLVGLSSFGQQKHSISGTIKDSKTGEILIGSTIELIGNKEFSAISNSYGFFSISAIEGNYTLVATSSGYAEYKINVSLIKDVRLTIELKPTENQLEEIIIKAPGSNNITRTLPGMQKIAFDEIKNVPVIFGEKDILKTILLLPGIKSGGEGSSGFFVRGGSADQNLILLDEATVYNASHLFGFFSTFNSDAIKEATIYKGDMPAQFGGRLSSLLDLQMNDGNNKEFKVNGGIGIISSRISVEGPIKKNKGSFIISARRTYADLFLKLSKDSNINQSILYFYDINAKANYEINEKNKVFFSTYFGKDKLGFGDQFGINWGNSTATLRWNHLFSGKLFSNTSLIYSNYNYNIRINQNANNLDIISNIKDYSLKEDLQYYAGSAHKINFGFLLTHHTFSPGRFETSASSSYNSLILQDKYALEGAAYISDEWNLSQKLKLNYGLRFSSFNVVGPGNFYSYDSTGKITDTTSYSSGQLVKSYLNLQPRFASIYQLNAVTSLKISYSRNVQNLHLISNSTGNNPTDLWIPSSNNVKPGIADQLSAGYYRNLNQNKYGISAEVYYKFLQNQIDYKNGAILVANENVESQLVFGKGKAYGIELYAKKNSGLLTGWISYTLSRTERKINGVNQNLWYPATQDQTHNFAIVAIYKAGKKWTLSGDFVYNTGNAVTWPSGKYEINGNTAFYYTDKNANRMPSYNRMDVSATWQHIKTSKFEGSWSFSIYNVYGRENPYFIQFQSDPEDPNKTQAIQYSLFKWVPSITYNFKF